MVLQEETTGFQTYRDVLAAFTETERQMIAQIKRFLECITGDVAFRQTIETIPEDPDMRKRLKKIGVEFAPHEMTPLWSQQATEIVRYWQWLMEPFHDKPAPPEPEIDDRWPLLKLWIRWMKASSYIFNPWPRSIPTIPKNPRFHAWYQRRVISAQGELGVFGNNIEHPIFAFELSRGCSVGCWFCGFATEKLSEVFEYTSENRTLWREIAQIGVDLLGTAAGDALCYYGTEPHDNPHYLDFLCDYREVTGKTICTTTAVPIQDPEWFRQLIAFYRTGPHAWPRVSVLSVSVLHQLHEIYTPEELRDVRLVMQMKNSPAIKVVSGRLLHGRKEDVGAQHIPDDLPFIPQGSIACVSGFLVNMVDRTIQLVSPCYASERWPRGYRVFAQKTFRDARSYRTALEQLISQHMPEQIAPDRRLAFRDDLQYTPTTEGFTLLSPNNKHHIKGQPYHQQLGKLLAQGNNTYQEIITWLAQQNEALPFDVSRIVTKLFNRGLLDEIQPVVQ